MRLKGEKEAVTWSARKETKPQTSPPSQELIYTTSSQFRRHPWQVSDVGYCMHTFPCRQVPLLSCKTPRWQYTPNQEPSTSPFRDSTEFSTLAEDGTRAPLPSAVVLRFYVLGLHLLPSRTRTQPQAESKSSWRKKVVLVVVSCPCCFVIVVD